MKNFKQYNESLRDQMSPVSEEDIRKKMGDEKYHIYKTVKDAKDSIEPPFEIDDSRTSLLTDDAQYSIIDAKLWWIRYLIRYNGKIWIYTSQYNDQKIEIKYRYWVEVYEQMKSDANKFFNKEIDVIRTEINRHHNKIKNMNKDLDIINKKD